MKLLSSYFLPAVFVLAIACSSETNSPAERHALIDSVIISEKLFESAPNDHFYIDSAYVENDSLKIKVSYGGGCGGAEWCLVARGVVLDAVQSQRQIRLSFRNTDNCLALLRKTLSFGIKPVQDGGDSVLLLLSGWEGAPLLYEY